MNKVNLIGRLVRDVEARVSNNGENSTCIARYTLAVDRKYKKQGEEQTADFINCIAFGKSGEFAEKYFCKGMKVAVCGRIQTGSYTNKDGVKVYTTDIVVEEQEFCESKSASQQNADATQSAAPTRPTTPASDDGFMAMPSGTEEELPFKS